MRATRTLRWALAGYAVLAMVGAASAQTPAPESAPLQLGGFRLEGYGEAGVRFFPERPQDKQNAKFEEYRDFNNGLFLKGLDLRFFTPDEKYSGTFGGRQWGMQDQEYYLGFERLGRWETGFSWDQMRHIFGESSLAALCQDLGCDTQRNVFNLHIPRESLGFYSSNPGRFEEISVRWDTARMFFKLNPSENVELFSEYTRTHKHGERPFGMAFGSPGGNALEVVQPIDQTIHDFRLRGTWATEQWQIQGGYTLSVFVNDFTYVRADNPCSPGPVPTPCPAATGQFGTISLPPNNMAHTFSLQGGLNLPMRTRFSGNFTYSLRLQNDDFLPMTSTNGLPASVASLYLPQKSLNGNVQTYLFNLNLTSRPLPVPVTFTTKYRFYELQDVSDVVKFSDFILNDQNTITRGPHWSERFGYRKQNGDTEARWQIAQPVALTMGAGWERWNRPDTREVPITNEAFGKLALDATPTDWLMTRLTYTPSFRRGNYYNTGALPQVEQDTSPGEPGQSYLLRKYDEADRNRHRVDWLTQITPIETLTITPTASYRVDNYIASGLQHQSNGPGQDGAMLGLQQVVSWSAGMDVNWTPVERFIFAAGYMHESIFQKQRSRYRNPDDPALDWISDNTDTINTYHASFTARLIPGRLDLKFGGNYAYALGRVETWNPNATGSAVYNLQAACGPPPPPGRCTNNGANVAKRWPAFEDSLLRLEASLRYYFAEAWSVALSYGYEQFRKHDWRTDTLNPFVPGNSAIYLGIDQKNYEAQIVGLTVGYRFK
jgi:MtrB/PioB family decaheme-associated outer membrane protein